MLFGLFTKGNFNLKDVRGPKGAKMISRGVSAVTGTDNYFFKQFEFCPYIRYPKLSLYQVNHKLQSLHFPPRRVLNGAYYVFN
jgi:hypothetical protein